MLKQFFKDTVIYSLSTILSRAIAFLLLPFYTSVLSPADYGIIDIIVVFTALVNVVITLEISQGVARFFPENQHQSDKIKYASTGMWFTITTYVLFTAVSYVFASDFSQMILGSIEKKEVFQVAVLSMMTNGIFYAAQNQLRWMLLPKAYAICNIFFTLVSTGLSVLFVLIMKMGVIGVFYGNICGNTAGAALSIYFARGTYAFTFDARKLKEMIVYAAPLVPSSLVVFVMNYVDRFAIMNLMTMNDVGLYGVAFRLASPINIAMFGIQGALTPLIITRHTESGTPSEIARIFRYFMAMALPVYVVISVFSKEILTTFTAPEYHSAYYLLPVLASALLFSGMCVFAPGLCIAKKSYVVSIINVFLAIMNVILNFALIPYLGIMGSAIASLAAQGAGFFVQMAISQKYYHVPHNWKTAIASTAIAVCLVLAGITAFDFPNPLHGILAKAAMLLIGIPIIAFRVLGKEEVARLLRFCRLTN